MPNTNPISEEKYELCISQCRELKKANGKITELAKKLLTSGDELFETEEEYLKSTLKDGDDLRGFLDDLLESDRSQWNDEIVYNIYRELYMLANRVVTSPYTLLEIDSDKISDKHKPDLQEMADKGFDMLRLIKRFGSFKDDED